MADILNPRRDTSEGAAVADLKTQLNKAYLSGNGAEVERVMALIAAHEPPPARAERATRVA